MAPSVVPKKPRRSELKPGEVACTYCTAKCCRYFALPIEKPTDWTDFEYIRWYVMHGRTAIFVEDDNWFLCVHAVCQHLQPDNRCGVYETRPPICSDYSSQTCEYEEDGLYDGYFETPDQVYEYTEALLGPPPGRSFRTPEPPLMPVVHLA